MEGNYSTNLLGAMDLLWYQQTIIFSQPNSLLLPLKSQQLISETLESPYEEDISPASSFISLSEDVLSDQPEEDCKEDFQTKLTRSSSQVNQCKPRKLYSPRASSLQRTRSCKSLLELELEEVKGFMDLGFEFKKESINPQMMSLVPGLQRLGLSKSEQLVDDDIIPIEDDKRLGVMRPYLSEAWLVKRSDSPLLNIRLPRVSATSEMKKQLKNWARTVASAVRQES